MEGINSISSVLAILTKGGVGIGLLIVAAAALIWWRTRSGHTIMFRIWSFFAANRGSSIKSVKQFHEKQAALLQFRFTTGMKVRTLPHMERVTGWAEEHDEDVGDIVSCGDYFDAEKPGLRESAERLKQWWELFPLTLVMVLSMGGFISGALTIPDRALLQLKDSGKLIMLGDESVKPLNGKTGFKIATCGTALPGDTGFTPGERQAMCDSFKSIDINEYVRSTVQEQRWVFGVFAIFLLAAGGPFWTYYKEMASARLMHGRLARRLPAATVVVKVEP